MNAFLQTHICPKENCGRSDIVGRGMCSMHYARERRLGVFTSPTVCKQGNGDNAEQRFWSRVALTADIERCWDWQAGRFSTGYGSVLVHGKTTTAHRAAWFYAYGVMPTLHVLHSCDNRICVNPHHLREGTNQDNIADKVSRNRQSQGEGSGRAKLTVPAVIKIRELHATSSISYRTLGSTFGVSRTSISRIINRQSWKHI